MGEKLEEDDAGVKRALAVFQAADVMVAQGLHQLVDRLLQRLNALGDVQVAVRERAHRKTDDLANRAVENFQLGAGGVGEFELLVVHLTRALHDVDGVIAHALEVHNEVDELVDRLALVLRELLVRQLDEILGDGGLQRVHDLLAVVHGHDGLGVIPEQQRDGRGVVVARVARHRLHGALGLLDGDGGGVEQALVQHRNVGHRLFVLAVGDGPLGQPRENFRERHEEERHHNVEQRVEIRDVAHVHRLVPPREPDHGAQAVDHGHEHERADDVEIQMHHGAALGRLRRADGRDERRGARADVLPEDDGHGASPRDEARRGQRLQNAHGRRRRLDGHRDEDARQNAEQRVLQRGEQLDEQRRVAQRFHGRGHRVHAREQQAEADHDLADVALFRRFQKHVQNRADERHDRREAVGLAQLEQQAAAGDVRQADQLARDGRADVCAHDDADGLRQLHDARVHEADDDDRRARGRLDDARDDRAQRHRADGGRRETAQNALHLSARDLLKTRAHDAHAVQEQSDASRKADDVEYAHVGSSS